MAENRDSSDTGDRAGERQKSHLDQGHRRGEARATEEEGNGGDVIEPTMTDISVTPSPMDFIIEIYNS